MENGIPTDPQQHLKDAYVAYQSLRNQRAAELEKIDGILQRLAATLEAGEIEPSTLSEGVQHEKRKTWTEEQKKRQTEIMRQKWAERKAQQALALKQQAKQQQQQQRARVP